MARVWSKRTAYLFLVFKTLCTTLVILIMSAGSVFAAEESPQSFTYQGRFLNAAGTAAIADGTYTVKFSVYDPAGSCLLYQESQSITTSNGFFSAQVGGAVADLKRVGGTDPSLSMQDVFSNKIKAVRPVAAPNCAAGYIPALGDGRKLRVENVTLGVVLTPDQTISSVPHAIVAESIQGIVPQNFVQIYPTGLPAAGTTLSDDTYAVNGANNNRAFVWDSVAGSWTETTVLSPRALSQEGAVAGKVLKWDASGFWLPGDDLDTAAGTMNGDVIGSYSATKVIALQNRPVAATAPGAGEVLAWDGSTWKPTAAGGAPSGAAGGDLSGTYPNPYVSKIHGIAITSSVPNSGDVLKYNGATWVYTSSSTTGGSASGDLSGTYPGPTVAKLQGNAIAAGAPTAPGQVLTWTGTEWAAASSNTLSDNLYVNITGDTMTGHLRVANSLTATGTIYSSSNIQMNATAINGMADPTLAQDAATKMYVDSKLGSLNLDTTGVATGGTGAGKYLKWDGNKWIADTVAAGTGTVTAVIAGHGLSITGDSITTSGTITADTLTLSTRTYAASKLGGLDLDTNGVATGGTGTNYALKWDGNKWVTYDPQATNDARYVNTAGDTMTGTLTMNDNIIMAGHTITQLGLSSETDSATNKAYVDALIANVGGSMSDYVRKTGDTMTGLLYVGSSMHVTGNVGIGTTSPGAALAIKSSGNTSATQAFNVQNSDAVNLFQLNNDGSLVLRSNGAWQSRQYIDYQSGSILTFRIGATNMLSFSHTGGSISAGVSMRAPNFTTDSGWRVNGTDLPVYGGDSQGLGGDNLTGGKLLLRGGTGLGTGTYGDVILQSAGGNVGIGLSSASTALDVSGAFSMRGLASVPATSGAGNSRMYTDTSGIIQVSQNDGAYSPLLTSSSLTNYILKSGDTMTGRLKVDGSSDVSQLIVEGHSTQTTKPFVVQTSLAAEKFAVDNSGYLYYGGSLFYHEKTTGSVSVGTNAFPTTSTGQYNTAVGNYALSSAGNTWKQTAIGYGALKNNSGSDSNTAIGYNALTAATSGLSTTVGAYSMESSLTGTYNAAFGYQALQKSINGNYNTAIGNLSLTSNTTGSNNTVVGFASLNLNYTGSNNTSVGYAAGQNNNGSNNVFIGNAAGQNETGSNTLYIDNSNTTTPLIFGDFSANSLTFNGQVNVAYNKIVNVGWPSATSDAATKAYVDAGTSCPAGFTEIKVAAKGRLGCMQTAEEGSTTSQFLADEDCFDTYGGRLPTAQEWYLSMSNYALTNETGNYEFVGDRATPASDYMVIGFGSITDITTGSGGSVNYRCFIPTPLN